MFSQLIALPLYMQTVVQGQECSSHTVSKLSKYTYGRTQSNRFYIVVVYIGLYIHIEFASRHDSL